MLRVIMVLLLLLISPYLVILKLRKCSMAITKVVMVMVAVEAILVVTNIAAMVVPLGEVLWLVSFAINRATLAL